MTYNVNFDMRIQKRCESIKNNKNREKGKEKKRENDSGKLKETKNVCREACY